MSPNTEWKRAREFMAHASAGYRGKGTFIYPWHGDYSGKGKRPGYTYRGARMNQIKHKGRKR